MPGLSVSSDTPHASSILGVGAGSQEEVTTRVFLLPKAPGGPSLQSAEHEGMPRPVVPF